MSKGDTTIPFSGDEASRFHHADGELPASPRRPAAGETRKSTRATAAAFGSGKDAGASSASASSFVPLGIAAHAVVLRLQGGFPKIRVRGAAEGGEQAAPLDDQREGKPR